MNGGRETHTCGMLVDLFARRFREFTCFLHFGALWSPSLGMRFPFSLLLSGRACLCGLCHSDVSPCCIVIFFLSLLVHACGRILRDVDTIEQRHTMPHISCVYVRVGGSVEDGHYRAKIDSVTSIVCDASHGRCAVSVNRDCSWVRRKKGARRGRGHYRAEIDSVTSIVRDASSHGWVVCCLCEP